jgi:hypothetical protein
MNDIEEATRLTVELAKTLIREMQALGTPWRKAFLRAEIGDGEETYKGSFVLDGGVHLMDVFEHKTFFAEVRELVPQLRDASATGDRRFCVVLLVVDSRFKYELEYEYTDAGRWAISKLGGGSGIPVGYAA